MNRRGHCGRVDANHSAVMEALRKAGINVASIAQVGSGVPDLVISWRNWCALVEVKDGDKPLTKQESDWHASWSGPIIIARSPEDAVLKVIAAAKEAGRV